MKDATAKEKEPVHENGEATASEESQAKLKLRSWLNQFLRIKMTDGRVLTGAFLCTDRDANIILGSCYEYLAKEHTEARPLGLVTVPGRHIVSIHLDSWYLDEHSTRKKRLPSQSE